MDKIKTFEINISDYYGDKCLIDSVNQKQGNLNRKPEGFVEIYEDLGDGKKQLVGKSNLVVYAGREMLAQRLVNIDNASVTATKDEYITWFGLGDGGVVPADPFDPIPPTNSDTDLASPVMINATDSSAADYHTVVEGYPKNGYYKKPFDSVSFERDVLNEDQWLVLKISTTIGINDANGEQISEAGLFSAESSVGGYSGNFTLFARVTFPSMIKSSDRRLIFTWYLYV